MALRSPGSACLVLRSDAATWDAAMTLEDARSNFTHSELSKCCYLLLAYVTLLSSAPVVVSLLSQEGLCPEFWLSCMAVVIHNLIGRRSQEITATDPYVYDAFLGP